MLKPSVAEHVAEFRFNVSRCIMGVTPAVLQGPLDLPGQWSSQTLSDVPQLGVEI